MGIRFHCDSCNTLLNVKDHQGGQEGICPSCMGEILVPTESSPRRPKKKKKSKRSHKKQSTEDFSVVDEDGAGNADDSFLLDKPGNPGIEPGGDPITDSPRKVWYIRHPRHSEKGPIKGKLLREMLDRGKVRPGSIVWREDWDDWLPVADVFSEVPSVQKPPKATRTVFSDPNYEIPGSMNPASVIAREQRKKLAWGIVAILIGLLTIGCLASVLFYLMK